MCIKKNLDILRYRIKKTYSKLDCISSEIITNLGILLGDSLWLSHDILANGVTPTYSIIATLFLFGYIGLIVSFKKHKRAEREKLLKTIKREINKNKMVI